MPLRPECGASVTRRALSALPRLGAPPLFFRILRRPPHASPCLHSAAFSHASPCFSRSPAAVRAEVSEKHGFGAPPGTRRRFFIRTPGSAPAATRPRLGFPVGARPTGCGSPQPLTPSHASAPRMRGVRNAVLSLLFPASALSRSFSASCGVLPRFAFPASCCGPHASPCFSAPRGCSRRSFRKTRVRSPAGHATASLFFVSDFRPYCIILLILSQKRVIFFLRISTHSLQPAARTKTKNTVRSSYMIHHGAV